jgi:hypothetical protein
MVRPAEPSPFETLLTEHHVLVPTDNPFQRRARLLQALWRHERGLRIGEHRGAESSSPHSVPRVPPVSSILNEATAAPSHRASAATPVKRGRGRPRGSKNAAPGAKSTGTLSVVESITAYVTQHPGTSGEAARKALKIDRNKWSPAVAKAIAGKRIRKEGEKRSTKYWGA